MSDEVESKASEAQPDGETRNSSLPEMIRRALLAAVGAVAMSKTEIEQLVNRLIERGELAEREGRQLIREVLERRKRQAEQLEQRIESDAASRMDQLLIRLNIPTKRDIEELSEQIARLSERIDELKRSREG